MNQSINHRFNIMTKTFFFSIPIGRLRINLSNLEFDNLEPAPVSNLLSFPVQKCLYRLFFLSILIISSP